MFISGARTWSTSSGQHARGSFVMLFQPAYTIGQPHVDELRCLVRHVRLDQVGQFMMGMYDLKLPNYTAADIVLSGPYGNDGLPMSINHKNLPESLWELLHPLPDELCKLYWHQAPSDDVSIVAIRKWVFDNLKTLRTLRKQA